MDATFCENLVSTLLFSTLCFGVFLALALTGVAALVSHKVTQESEISRIGKTARTAIDYASEDFLRELSD